MLEKQFVVSCNTNKFFWQQDFQITVKKNQQKTHVFFSVKNHRNYQLYGIMV